MITGKEIIEKFYTGPANCVLSLEALQECEECEDLESLMQTVSRHMDFDNKAQCALFIMDHLDWELD
mgnify:CR=1 FL=1|jgi:hypothetical protein